LKILDAFFDELAQISKKLAHFFDKIVHNSFIFKKNKGLTAISRTHLKDLRTFFCLVTTDN
jgi:hypothetical protein